MRCFGDGLSGAACHTLAFLALAKFLILRALRRVPEWSDISALMLAVEILSPSSLRNDRVLKRDFYLANNVEEYWIVDVDARVIERWLPTQETPELLRETLMWSPRGGEPLVIDLQALFARIDAKWTLIQEL